MEFNFINSILYLLLLFSSSRGSGDGLLGSGDSGGILGRGNGLIFLAIILLCLKDVEGCICEPECHCDNERCDRERGIDFLRADIARSHYYFDPIVPPTPRGYYDPYLPRPCFDPIVPPYQPGYFDPFVPPYRPGCFDPIVPPKRRPPIRQQDFV